MDGRGDVAPKAWLAAGFAVFACAALAFYHAFKGIERRRIAFEVALWFVVTGAIGYAMAG